MTDYPYHLSITSSISPDYQVMQKGLTDSMCILGFADTTNSDDENKVYQVFDINEAVVDFTGSNAYDSSLIRGLIEAYHAGCRDIYLYPIAEMSDYVAPADRDATFWNNLYQWYEDALAVLAEVDDIDVIIPYDVDISEGNFVELFATHCQSASGGQLRLTYLPYDGEATTTFTGEDYHIVLVNGTGTFHYPDHFETDYSTNMVTTFAAMVSMLDTNVPPDNRSITTAFLFSSDYEDDEETLEENSIVGFRKTVAYKRVSNGSLVSTLSYTRSSSNSDYRALYAVHTVQRLLRGIEKLDLIGSAVYLAEDSLREYFNTWVRKGYARLIESSFYYNAYELYVDIVLHLPYPIGEVKLNLTVGPVY
jgi:hypothetical protein